jgi:hypothetical protein
MIATLHICVAMKPLDGNFAQNALSRGVAGLNVDGCRIEIIERGEIVCSPLLGILGRVAGA